MTDFLFIQKFEDGKVVTMPYQTVMAILSRYGDSVRGLGDLEIILPHREVAASCTLIGDENGIRCIGFERPSYCDKLQSLVWACMQEFGCAVFNDTLDTVYCGLNGSAALPADLAAASIIGVQEISCQPQLWANDLIDQYPAKNVPVLRYHNRNNQGPDFQYIDYADMEQKHLYIELSIVPEACNSDTLRVIRNLELRLDAAITDNPGYYPLYRFNHPDSQLKFLESSRIKTLENKTTHISPAPFEVMGAKPLCPFIADYKIFKYQLNLAITFCERLKHEQQLAFDFQEHSISQLGGLLDKLHENYRQALLTDTPEQACKRIDLWTWVIQAGGFLATMIRRQVGGQAGYIDVRRNYQQVVVKTHRGGIYSADQLVLNHIINGPQYHVARFFQELKAGQLSAMPRQDDLVFDIPGFCSILQGYDHFMDDDGLPLEQAIPREKLDFSMASLALLEDYFNQVIKRISTFSDIEMNNLILTAGSYIGETLRLNSPDKRTWQWVTYQDYVLDNPEFVEVKPGQFPFTAFLDSPEQTTYPFAYVMARLDGAEMDSILGYVRHFLGQDEKEEQSVDKAGAEDNGVDAIRKQRNKELNAIDLQACINALDSSEHDYLTLDMPPWIENDPLKKLEQDSKVLLKHGKLVWGHIVQAHGDSFKDGNEPVLGGEVVYDPKGKLTPEELTPIASALFKLRQHQPAADHADDPNEMALVKIANYLNAETERVFGLPVPASISNDGLVISTALFNRKHLPGGKIVLSYFPILISDQCPGSIMLLPGRWWPKELLDIIEQHRQAHQLAAWQAVWKKLAQGRDEKDEEYFHHRINALERYAQSGVDMKAAAESARYGFIPFQPDTTPPPFEWEWGLDAELDSFAEILLTEVEAGRARGLPFNAQRARQAFEFQFLSLMISLHSALLSQQRGFTGGRFKILADQIQFAALGLAAGCEQQALDMAALLCHAWQRSDFYNDLMRPEVRVLFILFSEHLNIPIPELKPFRSRPHLEELIDRQRWLKADPGELYRLLNQACDEHTKNAPQGPFQGLPIAIVLILKLRMMRGLKNPVLTHALLEQPLALPEQLIEGDKDGYDDLLADVKKRMNANGFNAAAIEQAILSQSALQINSTAGVMPLDPQFIKPTTTWDFQINNTLTMHEQAYHAVSNSQAYQTQQASQGGNPIYSGVCWLVRLFTLFFFYLAAEEAVLGIIQTLTLTPLYKGLVICWAVLPFFIGAFATVKMKRKFLRDCGMLFSGITMYFFSTGVYSMLSPEPITIKNASFLLWGPGAQIIWIGGWVYLLLRKKA